MGKWFSEHCAFNSGIQQQWQTVQKWINNRDQRLTMLGMPIFKEKFEFFKQAWHTVASVELSGVQVDQKKYPSLQHNSAHIKGNSRIIPKPVVVKLNINNHPVRTLLDLGSLGNFISSTLVDRLAITRDPLDPPLSLHLAVQGSRSKVNAQATVKLSYQDINKPLQHN